MTGRAAPSPVQPGGAAAPDADAEYVAELLARHRGDRPGLGEAAVASWAEDRGALDGGRPARVAASCLLRPCAGDRVLAWSDGRQAWVLAVLERADPDQAAVLAASAPLNIEAPRIALLGQAVQVAAREFLSNVRNRHAVEDTRTEHSRLRVSEVGTDIRRAGAADERVSGTLVQRAGTWLSSTAREARLKARTFLFE